MNAHIDVTTATLHACMYALSLEYKKTDDAYRAVVEPAIALTYDALTAHRATAIKRAKLITAMDELQAILLDRAATAAPAVTASDAWLSRATDIDL